MTELINFYVYNFLIKISYISACGQDELFKIINDIFLLWNDGIGPNLALESKLEEIADVNILFIPNNVWSLLNLNLTLLILILMVFFLPLFCCFFIIAVFCINHFHQQFLGNWIRLEYWTPNLLIFSWDTWWIIWAHLYNYMPRYNFATLIFQTEVLRDRKDLKFPNPWHSLYFLYNLFLNKHRPRFLKYFMYFLLIVFSGFFADLEALPVFLFCYYLIIFLIDRKQNRWWPMGYKLFRIISYYQKKKVFNWGAVLETFHLNSPLIFYAIFLCFLTFIVSTCLLFLLYMDFFFNPILTWNGYFSKTIICFFLSTASFTYWINLPVVFDYFLAFDGLNIWLVWLTTLLVYLCALFLLDTIKMHNFFSQMGWIFLLEFASIQFFCVPNYLWMYIYFELSLLPIFILIVFWGSNRWKVHAAYQMVLFTFIGSLFLLAGIFMLFIKIWSFNCFDIFYVTQSSDLNFIFSNFEKKIIWLLLFIGFAVKTPLYPFHIWLPEAHSEAPTTGSVLLAGVLLKMGTYGFLWFVIPLFPSVLETFKTLVFSMCLCGVLLSSLAALAQIDIKKIIAYSSIGHMGLVIIGIYNLNMNGLLGASYMMLSHGLISSALFFSIGILYKIYGTWSIVYYSTLAHFMPWFSMCFFIFSLANMSFPGTAGFPGEILIFASMMADNFFLSLFVGVGSIFGGVYSIWLLTWILYGQISPKIAIYRDIKPSEWKILNFLLILILLFGIFPFLILDFFKPMCVFFISLSNT